MGFDESNIKKFGFKKSDWNKAAKAYNETLDGGDEGVCGDRAGESRAYCDLGITFRRLGQYSKAVEFCIKALNISCELHTPPRTPHLRR